MKKIQNSTYSPLEILPKNDLVFKKILENTNILRAFIADVLGVERTTIQNVELLNTEILPNDYTSKFCRLDVKASIDGSLIDIEIQRYDRKDFVERAIYYLSRLCSSSINQGD
ncbi:MAG: Rpn family recombination-promoting nuclease/putative transposase, partial [Oscillospiraceae bacterium]|nr:Rpn family recombination-promoting nuclease/putative transposase [Oscillospiraceae bacterium]